jgi:hypothetical protein
MKLKRFRQANSCYCGPATTQMLVSEFGLELDQDVLVEVAGAKKTVMKAGITLEEIARGVKKIYPDLVIWQKMNSKIEDVAKMLKQGYRVGVDWQGIFSQDDYNDDEYTWLDNVWNKLTGAPELKGFQGHYCVALEVDIKRGYVRYADPYGHYAGKDRFIAIWEFLERWWDDRVGRNKSGKKIYVFENRLMFLITKKNDILPKKMGMKRVIT